MNCDRLARLLADYTEGTAPEPLCQEIERHLRDCSPCAELRQDLSDLAKVCREAATPRLPEDIRRRIAALLAGSSG